MSEKKQIQQNQPKPKPKSVSPAVTPVASTVPMEYMDTLPDYASARPLRQAQLLQMQQQHGNAYVQRALKQQGHAVPESPAIQRDLFSDAFDWVGDRVGDLTDSRPDEARLDAQEELADFMSQEYSLTNHHPSTGRGLFNAAYNPRDGQMTITVKIHFAMTNGDPADPEWLASVGGPAVAATYAPEQFQWQGDEAENWKRNAIRDVQSFWGERYTFFTTEPYWESLPPVDVNVQVAEAPADGEEDEMAHFVITVRKWPTDGGGLEESITPPGADDNQSTGRFEESANDAGGIEELDTRSFTRDTHTRARYGEADTANPGQIFFAQGSSNVSGADRTRLQEFGKTMGLPYMPPFPVTLTGHSSSEGSDEGNMVLSEDRAREVNNEIVSGGPKTQPTIDAKGEEGADETFLWRRVDITIGDFQTEQHTVLHEFGHIFGLGDEYPSADTGSRTVGTEVAHSDLAERLIPGQEPVVAHHSENIMSNGELVQPHHYVTFLEALGQMSDSEGKWDVRPSDHTGEMGDFPEPSGDTMNA
jgi:outer membrane protein OmpA-like peptidoglycan-associated protein